MFDQHIFTRHTAFSEPELTALKSLRSRYRTDPQVFTDRELARLRFVRWLVHRPEWNRALDQPVNAKEPQITPPRSLPWTPGLAA
jgi:hypothetical protein